MQLHVIFKPIQIGDFDDTFTIRYETGDELVVRLSATAISAAVYLEKDSVLFDDTYIGMKTHKTIKFFNESKHIVHFEFKNYENKKIDEIELNEFKRIHMDYECYCDTCDCNEDSINNCDPLQQPTRQTNLFCTRVHDDEMTAIEKREHFYFSSRDFAIVPRVNICLII